MRNIFQLNFMGASLRTVRILLRALRALRCESPFPDVFFT